MLADAIFTPSLQETQAYLQEHVWSPHVDLTTFLAIMNRPNQDTSLDYIKRVCNDIANGGYKSSKLSVEGVAAMIQDYEARSVKDYLQGNTAHEKQRYKQFQTQSNEERWFELADELLSTNATQESDDDDNDEEEHEEKTTVKKFNIKDCMERLVWKHRNLHLVDFCRPDLYGCFMTVFYRVNGAKLLIGKQFQRDKVYCRKLERYLNAHIPIILHLDSLEDPRNADCFHLYEPLGDSHYPCDLQYCHVETKDHKVRPTPLDIITRAFPHVEWVPERHVLLNCKDCTQTHLINGKWSPVSVAHPSTHRLYYAVVHVLNQIHNHLGKGDCDDALWAYYASYVDLFYKCKRFDDMYLLSPLGTVIGRDGRTVLRTDKPAPWNMWGTCCDTRAFVAGDLPNLMHVMTCIPLHGEKRVLNFFLGRIYHKSMPFANYKRYLAELILDSIAESKPFCRLFSCLMWVLLANLYPGRFRLSCAQTMQDLVRVKELTCNPQLMVQVLSAKLVGIDKSSFDPITGGSAGGPLILHTIIRMHMLYMISLNPLYRQYLDRHIKWGNFETQVLKMATTILSHGYNAQDPFALARRELSKKNVEWELYRMRIWIPSVSLMRKFNEPLEKKMLRDKQLLQEDRQLLLQIGCTSPDSMQQFLDKTTLGDFLKRQGHVIEDWPDTYQKALEVATRLPKFYSQALCFDKKSAIFNALLDIPKECRLSSTAFEMLLLPQHGGVSEECIAIMEELVEIYHDSMPRETERLIEEMSVREFMIACYYFNAVALLDKISFLPHDADTTREIDLAVIQKHQHMYPGQPVPQDLQVVQVALCCERVYTIFGNGRFGNKRTAYDVDKMTYVCARKRKEYEQDDEDEEDDDEDGDQEEGVNPLDAVLEAEEQGAFNMSDIFEPLYTSARAVTVEKRKLVRNERKEYSRVPCGQPLLPIDLRGRILVFGNVRDKKLHYSFCPRCGGLHSYTRLNFAGSELGGYRCNECAKLELMHVPHYACAYCNKAIQPQVAEKNRVRVKNIDQAELQWIYLCNTHCVRPLINGMSKNMLWAKIKRLQDLQARRYQKKRYPRIR